MIFKFLTTEGLGSKFKASPNQFFFEHRRNRLVIEATCRRLKTKKYEPIMGFEDFLKSDHYVPVFHKAHPDDFQQHRNSLIDNP